MKTLINQLKIEKIIKKHDLKSPARCRKKVFMRCFMFNYLRDQGMTLKEIGSLFERDHPTVIHGLKTYDDMIITGNKHFEKAVYEIALILNKEYIFDEPLVNDIQKALENEDCEELKRIAEELFKKVTGVDHKRKLDNYYKNKQYGE